MSTIKVNTPYGEQEVDSESGFPKMDSVTETPKIDPIPNETTPATPIPNTPTTPPPSNVLNEQQRADLDNAYNRINDGNPGEKDQENINYAKENFGYVEPEKTEEKPLEQNQIDELNKASERIRNGNAGEQDQANIDFAKENYGYVEPEAPMNEETDINQVEENTFDTQIQSMVDKMEEIYNNWLSDFEAIQNGTFALTEQEQGLLKSIETSLISAKNAQIEANKNYEAMMAQSGISSGRNRYSPEIEAGNIKNSVDVGIAKISELDSQALKSKYELEQLIKENNLTQITSKYEQMQGYLQEKAQTLINTEEIIKNYEIEQQKLKSEAQKDVLDYQKDLIVSGYTPITEYTDLSGLTYEDILTFNGTSYIKPKEDIDSTTSMKEYALAIETGYTGSYMDFINAENASYDVITDPMTGETKIFNTKTGKFVGSGYSGGNTNVPDANWEPGKSSLNGKVITDVNGAIYDFTRYATDENQVNAVYYYVNQIGKLASVDEVDALLEANGVNSFTGQQFIDAANEYGISWEVMLGLMQHESYLGKSPVAVDNNNFGGITFNNQEWIKEFGGVKGSPRTAGEGGYYVKFPTVEDGLRAQAKLLKDLYKKSDAVTTKTTLTHEEKVNSLTPTAKSVYDGTRQLKDLTSEQQTIVGNQLSSLGLKTKAEEEQKVNMEKEFDQNIKKLEEVSLLIKGIDASSGPIRFARTPQTYEDKSKFLAEIDKIISSKSLQALIDAKNSGATFGALSNAELSLLASSATALGGRADRDKNSGMLKGFKAGEEYVKEQVALIMSEMQRLNALSKARGDIESGKTDIETVEKDIEDPLGLR
ncbi:MAG: hypothetical protein EOL95_09175 [Bacteroidia bacterium]|nr:hypothetical protein [Bacteroidia bacterium]